MHYCANLTKYQRRESSFVKIGNTWMGGKYPVRLQSMTNTPTSDITKTVSQCIKIIKAGADYVRITTPGVKDIDYLKQIRNQLRNQGYSTPIIADIHFNPEVAEQAAHFVEKVRINPGNYTTKRKKRAQAYSYVEYQQEIDAMKARIVPLINICKSNGTAIRIGVNHGSLSDRIMDRYGDTPEGMAESAMEFLRICRELEFENIVVSMKASNTRVMVYANRLLLIKMQKENMYFPLHLGVTEAGEGEDGRIKSAVGIGTMLADGIGETVRVSLTEPPEREIPVANKIVQHFQQYCNHKPIPEIKHYPVHPYEYKKRTTILVHNIGNDNVPVVISDASKNGPINQEYIDGIGWNKHSGSEERYIVENTPDYIFAENIEKYIDIPEGKGIILPVREWEKMAVHNRLLYPLYDVPTFLNSEIIPQNMHFISVYFDDLSGSFLRKINKDQYAVLVCLTKNRNSVGEQRRFIVELMNQNIDNPVIIKKNYLKSQSGDLQISAACDTGPLFIDGLGDGLWLENQNQDIPDFKITETAYGILQASRVRISKTEYISCPGCGRTLFNLEETTARIRKHTQHLKGLKIGIMGCIVNGPGEMADADYGYVGAGRGKITLYKNKEVIKKNIPEPEALDELIALIKENGDWRD